MLFPFQTILNFFYMFLHVSDGKSFPPPLSAKEEALYFEAMKKGEMPYYLDPYLDYAIKAIEDRPTGKWVDTGDMAEYWAEEYQCSICGAKDHWHNYCPNCGARMEIENEDAN